MKFRLWTILWAFAVLASAMATFGGWGILAGLCVVGFWALDNVTRKIVLLTLFAGLVLFLFSASTALPAHATSLKTPKHVSCNYGLRSVSRAVNLYVNAREHFPSVSEPMITDSAPVSWRLRILIFLDLAHLYYSYDFNEIWNSPTNSKVTNLEVEILQCREDRRGFASPDTRTSYFAVVGEDTVWPNSGVRYIADIRDDLETTIILMEAGGRNVKWAEPVDLTFEDAVHLLTSSNQSNPQDGHIVHDGFFYRSRFVRNIAFADGSVKTLNMPLPEDLAIALLTCAGGEEINSEELNAFSEAHLNYGRIYSLSVFMVLSILPILRRSDFRASSPLQGSE